MNARRILSIVAALPFAVSCGAGSDAGHGDETAVTDAGEVSLALTTVPSGVQCVRIATTGSTTSSQDFPVTAGTSSVFSIGRFATGNLSITATAFDVACASTSGVQGSWVSDPLTVAIKGGVIARANVTLRPNNPVSAKVNFAGNIVQVLEAGSFTLVLFSDGTVKNYGCGGYLATLTNVVEVAGGDGHACARKSDGTVWCVGMNDVGQVGVGTTTNYYGTPQQVPGITNAIQIVASYKHTCANTPSSTYCWGYNASGQLGDGTTTNRTSPVATVNYGGFERIAAGASHTCGSSAAFVYCWGANAYGQLGDGTTTSHLTPTSVMMQPFTELALGARHSCGVRADGGLRCWGNNFYGQLGDGTTTSKSSATAVSGITDAVDVSAYDDTTCVRRQNGSVACFGYNMYGDVGDGTADPKLTPTTVTGFTGNAIGVTTGEDASCTVLDNQQVWCWGSNQCGQLGDGATIDRFKAVQFQP